MDNYDRSKGQQLMVLFLLGCLLFNYPVLLLFSRDGLVWGIPILYVFVFLSWAALVGLMALIIEVRK